MTTKKWSRHGYNPVQNGNNNFMRYKEELQKKVSKAQKDLLFAKTNQEYDLYYMAYVFWSNKLNNL